jgi:hypothetical protein
MTMKVYVLQHVHVLSANRESVKLIGIYSSAEKAERAIRTLSKQPGFSNSIEGFHIDAYEVDKDHWTEGYVTV